MLNELKTKLFKEIPSGILYHYTSFSGLMGIVESRKFWLSEIRYLNDANELDGFGKILVTELKKRLETANEMTDVVQQFEKWLPERLKQGPKLFVGSFTENGNLLSQWRGYCTYGKGISIGIDSARIRRICESEGFVIGKCIYDYRRKENIAKQIVEAVIKVALERGPSTKFHPMNSYYGLFKEIEPELLVISAILKDQAFHEENEWRIISKPISNYLEHPIQYREGDAMLIPYLELPLYIEKENPSVKQCMLFDEVILGPTNNINLSMNSVSEYLSRKQASNCVKNSMNPLR